MTPKRDSLFSDRPPGWPAWCVSLVIHLSLFGAVFYLLQPPNVRGAAENPTREVGIVLKKQSDDGPVFESEEDQQQLEESASEAILAALPEASEFPKSADAPSRLPVPGPGTPLQDPLGSVSEMARGGAPSKHVGRPATVSVFGLEGTGTRFVYVFDRSISMAGAPLRAAKRQLVASLESLDSVHQFQVIFFNHEPQAWDLTGGQGRIAFATDANKRLAEKFVRGVSATGGTFRRTALRLALRLRPDVIFFLTDTDDPMAAGDLADAIRRARRDAIAINTIEYGNGTASTGDNFLVRLARETSGQYVYVDTGGLKP